MIEIDIGPGGFESLQLFNTYTLICGAFWLFLFGLFRVVFNKMPVTITKEKEEVKQRQYYYNLSNMVGLVHGIVSWIGCS